MDVIIPRGSQNHLEHRAPESRRLALHRYSTRLLLKHNHSPFLPSLLARCQAEKTLEAYQEGQGLIKDEG